MHEWIEDLYCLLSSSRATGNNFSIFPIKALSRSKIRDPRYHLVTKQDVAKFEVKVNDPNPRVLVKI